MPPRTLAWIFAALAALVVPPAAADTARPQARTPAGWQLPPDADELQNPLKGSAEAIDTGRTLYAEKCRRCHGPGGLGDGPDADPEDRATMDLTNPKRAGRNPDGIVFHKILNGRGRPEMPAFRDELSTEQIWALVAYVQTLRREP